MTFSENLRYLRHLKNESQDQLSHFLGYKSFTTIQKWEDGSSLPSLNVIKKIADHYQVPLDIICNQKISDLYLKTNKIPVLGTVKAGYGLLAMENISGYEIVSEKESSNGTYFYLDVVGDSMKNARILDGDRVYCRQQALVDHGDIAVILLENDEVTLKRVLFEGNKMILKPENDDLEALVFTDQEISEKGITILGKLVHNKILY